MTDIKNLRKRSIANIYSQLEQRYKILIVDNQYEFRDYLECDLSKWLQIITDNCGHGGIQKAKNEMPDLIIYELRIPDIDGFEFVKIIKEELETSHIPIILLTTKISDESIIRCISLGVNAIIIKPFEIDYLLLYIVNLLLNNQRLKQKFIRDIVVKPNEQTASSRDASFLTSLIEIVEQHLDNTNLTPDFIAEKIGISNTSLYHKIKALTEQTVGEFVRSIRLKKAAIYLSSKEFTVSEVIYKCGFQNHSYFYRCFKEMFRCTPSQYAMQMEKKN